MSNTFYEEFLNKILNNEIISTNAITVNITESPPINASIENVIVTMKSGTVTDSFYSSLLSKVENVSASNVTSKTGKSTRGRQSKRRKV